MAKAWAFLTNHTVNFREGMYLALGRGGDYGVIGEAFSDEEAISAIEKLQPEVVILDAGGGRLNAAEIARRIRGKLPSVAVILILDSCSDGEQIYSALKSGARACLSRDTQPDELLESVKKIAQGEYPITQEILRADIARRIIIEFEDLPQQTESGAYLPARLLPFERQILQHIAGGKSVGEIVQELNITEDIIRQRLYIIRGKLLAIDKRSSPEHIA